MMQLKSALFFFRENHARCLKKFYEGILCVMKYICHKCVVLYEYFIMLLSYLDIFIVITTTANSNATDSTG